MQVSLQKENGRHQEQRCLFTGCQPREQEFCSIYHRKMIDNLMFQKCWTFSTLTVYVAYHMLNMPTCTSRKQWKRTLSHDITSLSHQMAEQFKIMFCFPLGVGMGDIPCITLYTKKYGYRVKISSLLTNYIYINFFYIQNLRVKQCCLENRQMLCRYPKCSVKALKF